MRKTLHSLIILFFLTSCKGGDNLSKGILPNKLNDFLSRHYSFTSNKKCDISKPDQLRSRDFFTSDLKNATAYYYYGPEKEHDSDKHSLILTIYQYSSQKSAERIEAFWSTEKERRVKEGEYGPLGKDFQFFMQTSNYVAHMEGSCDANAEQEWLKSTDSLIKIAEHYFGKKPSAIIKVCE